MLRFHCRSAPVGRINLGFCIAASTHFCVSQDALWKKAPRNRNLLESTTEFLFQWSFLDPPQTTESCTSVIHRKMWITRRDRVIDDEDSFFLVGPTDDYVLRCWLNRSLFLGRSRRRILKSCVVSKATSRTTPRRNLLRLQWNLFKVISDSTQTFFILQDCTLDMHKIAVHRVIDDGVVRVCFLFWLHPMRTSSVDWYHSYFHIMNCIDRDIPFAEIY